MAGRIYLYYLSKELEPSELKQLHICIYVAPPHTQTHIYIYTYICMKIQGSLLLAKKIESAN